MADNSLAEDVHYLFVYGTLQRGERLHRHIASRHPVSMTPATMAGSLIALTSYPALIEPTHPDARAAGELYEFNDMDSILPQLDEIEGREYRRVVLTARREAGTECPAYVYLWNGSKTAGPPIPGGDWRAWRRKQSA